MTSKRLSIIPAAAVFDRQLRRTDLAVLCALGAYANHNGECWPATTTLAEDIDVSTRMVRRCLRALESCGYVKTTHRRGQRSTYRVVGGDAGNPGHIGSGVEPDPGHIGSGEADTQVPGTPDTGVPPKDTIKDPLKDTDSVESAQTEFDTFWQSYPSRRPHPNPKTPALAKFEAAVKKGTPSEGIIRGARNFATYVQRERTEAKYVAQAQTWLSQERWTDYQTAMSASEAAYDSDVIH